VAVESQRRVAEQQDIVGNPAFLPLRSFRSGNRRRGDLVGLCCFTVDNIVEFRDGDVGASLAADLVADLDEDQRARLRAAHVGFVFQSFQLLDSLNALENVMLPLELHGHGDARNKAAELLERVGLASRLHHYPRQLSGGEQQRVAVARAFAAEPDVLFADEPTGNLDSHTGATIIELLFELNRERGTTLVLVTHDERLAQRCQHLLRLEGGREIRDEVSR